MVWTDIFIKRPVLSVVVSLLILLIGFRAATSLPIRQYPKLSNTVVNVTTVYPGASADLIQGFITTPIEQAVASADGVASADILGGQTFAMRLWLDPVRMAGRNVSPDDVTAAIRANNFQAAAGQAKGYFVVSNVTTDTDLKNLDQFKRMIIKSKDGGFVRIEDIATVELAAQSTDASVAFNAEHAIFTALQATPQGNPLTLVRGVRALLPVLEHNLPPSM